MNFVSEFLEGNWGTFFVYLYLVGFSFTVIGALHRKDELLFLLRLKRCSKYRLIFFTQLAIAICVNVNYKISQDNSMSNHYLVKSGFVIVLFFLLISIFVNVFYRFIIARIFVPLDQENVEKIWIASMIQCCIMLFFVDKVISLAAIGILLGKFVWFDFINDLIDKIKKKGLKKIQVIDLLSQDEEKMIRSKKSLYDSYMILHKKMVSVDMGDTYVIIITEYVWTIAGTISFYCLCSIQSLRHELAMLLSILISLAITIVVNLLASYFRKKIQPCSAKEYYEIVKSIDEKNNEMKKCIKNSGKSGKYYV